MSNKIRNSVFIGYLRQNLKIIILLAVFSVIFFAVFSLAEIDTDIVAYSALLCLFFLLIFWTADFAFFLKKHKTLKALMSQITLTTEGLPTPSSVIERDYSELIETLHENKTLLLSAADARASEMLHYYTLWAHQIKTPIAAMRLLLQTENIPQSSELDAELFKIEQYVEMVLTYLKIDGAESDYVIRHCDLDKIVKQSVRKYAKQFIRKKISLELSELNKTVLTDEKWLSFVIEQLLSNSLKYTHSGKIRIYIEGDYTLVIEDSGIGISAEDLPRICECGFTGYNGHSDKKSTGIGLYLCKRILKKLGHSLKFSSVVGVGTKARIGLEEKKLEIE